MQLTRRAALMGLILAGSPLPLAAKGETRLTGRAFGGGWTLLARDLAAPEAAAGGIGALIAAIDAEMSPYRREGALARFNAGATRVAVGPDLAQVAAAALRMAEVTGGAYDPTVGPLVNRYGFGPITAPSTAAIPGGHRRGLWRELACEGGQLTGPAAATLDLCGIAKGFAVDAVFALLAAEARDFILEIGGEIRAAGAWPVAIADPRGGVARRITLRDGALATSGDGVQGFAHGGRRWSHIIDPKTGAPVTGDLASVSVLSPQAMEADALATALMVMGEVPGRALTAGRGRGTLFLSREGEGLRARADAGFDAVTF